MTMRDQGTKSPAKLPRPLRRFFWDYDFDVLSWERDRGFITGRILTHGNWEAVIWLRSVAGDQGLRQWIMHHQGRELSPQQLRFWELILGLPCREVNSWLETQPRRFWVGEVLRGLFGDGCRMWRGNSKT
jgi:hypothetical protein